MKKVTFLLFILLFVSVAGCYNGNTPSLSATEAQPASENTSSEKPSAESSAELSTEPFGTQSSEPYILPFVILPELTANQIEVFTDALISNGKMETFAPHYDSRFYISDEYELIWEDHFDGDLLNYDDWKHEMGYVRGKELQAYTDNSKNTIVSNSILTLVAYKEPVTARVTESGHMWHGRGMWFDSNFTSSSIRAREGSNSIFTIGDTSGALEMYAKLPSQGMCAFPAFWTFSDELRNGRYMSKWHNSTEIDILELWGTNFNRYTSGLIWRDGSGYPDSRPNDFYNPRTPYRQDTPIGNEWHLFGMEWTPETISFYCDDTIVYSVDISGKDMDNFRTNANSILLNLALIQEGERNGADSTPDNEFPIVFQIDYVRLYQKIRRV